MQRITFLFLLIWAVTTSAFSQIDNDSIWVYGESTKEGVGYIKRIEGCCYNVFDNIDKSEVLLSNVELHFNNLMSFSFIQDSAVVDLLSEPYMNGINDMFITAKISEKRNGITKLTAGNRNLHPFIFYINPKEKVIYVQPKNLRKYQKYIERYLRQLVSSE